MTNTATQPGKGLHPRFIILAAILLAAAVFAVTWITISESRRDSFQLLVKQGTAFTEALALAADNAMEAEQFADYLLQRRYNEIVTRITEQQPDSVSDLFLTRVAQSHGLLAVLAFDTTGQLIARGIARPLPAGLPSFVQEEIEELWANPEVNYTLLLDADDEAGAGVLYYLQISNDLDHIVLLADEAVFYMEGLRRTQIGYLAQSMAREQGVEYIIYQTTDGIVFASRKPGLLPAIEADPFLQAAFAGDSINHRTYEFQGKEVLELVRPFATVDYPVGVLRVGLSLDNYHDVKHGFDMQMVTVSAVLFLLVLVMLLYIQSRLRGSRFRREYRSIKTVTDKVFEEMRIGVATIGAEGRILMSNGAFDRTFGSIACTGKLWDDVFGDTQISFDKVVSSPGDIGEIEVSIVREGERRVLLVALSRLEAYAEPDPRFVAVVYDITRLRDLQQKAARRERLSELGDLAAGVAHEIRNPLNTISIAAQRLASEFTPQRDEEQFALFTRQIRSETRRLNDIITRFLALAREDHRRQSRVDLGELLVAQVRLWGPEASELGIEVKVDLPNRPVTVRSDPDAIRQVLVNLFANAREALDGAGGTVSIELRDVDNRAQILFADNGPGIAPAIQSRVFTPYFTTKDSGTGLGLATVDRIMTDLAGEVRLDTDYAGGARFVLSLPRFDSDSDGQ